MGGADFERRTPECRGRGSWGGLRTFCRVTSAIAASQLPHRSSELLWAKALCQNPSSLQLTMVLQGNILFLLLLPVATAQTIPGEKSALLPLYHATSASCSGCGPLSLPLLAGLVATDAVVSLLIVAVVFVCARPRSRPTQEDGKIYINMPGRG
ncbi:hematopoietic cell signal transducer isoform X3 [Pteropus vampyrus]|uniref:Hematopoietic cell signal transducer n=1 Tax=Pteropus vampyrus TaxID=132908 RepID=A0A6P6BXZ5_PTEVA|nr:hematopoietic cell signal transducer isoform X3 [Pteropus vampyrus]